MSLLPIYYNVDDIKENSSFQTQYAEDMKKLYQLESAKKIKESEKQDLQNILKKKDHFLVKVQNFFNFLLREDL